MEGHPIRAVFNGNTIVDQDHWGQQELVRTWTRFMAERKAEDPATPLYWYLISSGYRTYMYLPLFYREFYPRYDRPTPRLEQRLLDTLVQPMTIDAPYAAANNRSPTIELQQQFCIAAWCLAARCTT